jgi:hypothetical protein
MADGNRMKSYDTFDLWAADQSAKHRKIAAALRKLVQKTAPTLSEAVKWGNGCWVGKKYPVAYLHAEEDHLQFGFFGGAGLADPKELLVGSGKFVRHIKVRSLDDIDSAAFSQLIRQAVKSQRV